MAGINENGRVDVAWFKESEKLEQQSTQEGHAALYARLRAQAQRVFDVFVLKPKDATESELEELHKAFAEVPSTVISENLNLLTMPYFLALIVENQFKVEQSLRAHASHIEHRSMKADVFAWLDANTVKFKSNEAAAMAITKQQPVAHVTARDWYKEWKKLRSASTP